MVVRIQPNIRESQEGPLYEGPTPPRHRGKSPRCRFMQEATRLSSIAEALHEAHEAYVEAMLKKQSRTALSEREEALLQESQEWLNEHKKTCPHVDSSQEGLAR